jgi:methylated-DNA-[protein]-cysteine S-methyltransferase
MNAVAMKSPIGTLTLVENEGALVGLYLENGNPPPAMQRSTPLLKEAQRQLREYFAGERSTFELPLRLEGTAFQRAVWGALAKIPFGKTCSYADIARRVGRPKAVRAVGAANGANPIALVIPCHRVIGADGSLTGYGGGLPRKKWLLAHERLP